MNRRDWGNIAEAKAISVMTQMGYNISFPLTEDNHYDLIAEKDGDCKLVQVKGTRDKRSGGFFAVELRTSWSPKKNEQKQRLHIEMLDYLVVVTPENVYVIPADKVDGKTGLWVRSDGKYSDYIY